MNQMLICPEAQEEVPFLSRDQPLVLAPFLGSTVLERAMRGLAASRPGSLVVAAPHRTEEVRAAVQNIPLWGLKVLVTDGIEFSGTLGGSLEHFETFLLDRLPQLSESPLWRSYRHWHAAQLAFMPEAARLEVGVREVSPGVFVGLGAKISPTATLRGPSWIGPNAFIGKGVRIGPNTIVEKGAYIDNWAEVTNSVIGKSTYLGEAAELQDSYALGSELLHMERGSFLRVVDRFLLADLRPSSSPAQAGQRPSLLGCVRKGLEGFAPAGIEAVKVFPKIRSLMNI